METTTARLRYVLSVLAPAIADKKATLPILANVVVGQGRAYAQNLETAITVEFPEATDDPVLLPHRDLLSVLRYIPGPTRLSINREGNAVKLAAGATSAEFLVPGEVKDFPPLPKLQAVGEGQVDADLFLKTATAIAEYAATDESRPTLQCVCITLGAPLEMAGADGFRLAWQTMPMALPALNSSPIAFRQLLLPTTAVVTLAKLWKVMEKQPTVDGQGAADPLKQDGGFRLAMQAVAKRMATIRFTRTALSFEHGAVTVRVHLTEGDFPNYHALIPSALPNKVTFDAEGALRAVRSLAEVAADWEGILRLNWADGRLTFSARAEEAGAVASSIPAHIKGEEAKIAFNIKYLTEYLQGKLGMVLLETSAVDSPGRFYHAGSPDVLVMPMFVVWGKLEGDTETPVTTPSAEAGSPLAATIMDAALNGAEAEVPSPEPAPAVTKPRARARRPSS